MEKFMQKASTLVEALPYIKEFANKKIVIKYGGGSMTDSSIIKKVVDDVVLLKLIGMQPIIVHGGGPEINKYLTSMNIKSEFINGLRVTDSDTIDIVEMVLSGRVNKHIVKLIGMHDMNAVGISGADGKLIEVNKLDNGSDRDLGFVGEIKKINTKIIDTLLENDYIPVIAPVGVGSDGHSYNVNADFAASEIAASLGAEKLLFLTNVQGILKDVNDPSSLISEIEVANIDRLLRDGTVTSGMIPKVNCCVNACRKGVKSVHIIDGTLAHSIILEILTESGIGTVFKSEA